MVTQTKTEATTSTASAVVAVLTAPQQPQPLQQPQQHPQKKQQETFTYTRAPCTYPPTHGDTPLLLRRRHRRHHISTIEPFAFCLACLSVCLYVSCMLVLNKPHNCNNNISVPSPTWRMKDHLLVGICFVNTWSLEIFIEKLVMRTLWQALHSIILLYEYVWYIQRVATKQPRWPRGVVRHQKLIHHLIRGRLVDHRAPLVWFRQPLRRKTTSRTIRPAWYATFVIPFLRQQDSGCYKLYW